MRNPPADPIESWWRQWVVDEAIDAYVGWRDECRAVWGAYRRWTCASAAEAGFAFEGYLAALAREERAAEVYRDQMRVVDYLFGGDPDHQPAATRPTLRIRRQKPQRP